MKCTMISLRGTRAEVAALRLIADRRNMTVGDLMRQLIVSSIGDELAEALAAREKILRRVDTEDQAS